MTISFYDKGELSSGFHGWRVVVTIRGKRYQKYFSARRPNARIPQELWNQYQETRARYYEARWVARSAALKYLNFINTNHPNTRPHRGVGFQGITLGIDEGKQSGTEQCFFSVNDRRGASKFFINEQYTLSRAWENAVSHWGEVFDVRKKDIEQRLKRIPSPEQFKALRKYMNQHEGRDLSASVLHHVFAERRADLEKQKRNKKTDAPFSDEDLIAMQANLAREISQYQK